LFDTPSGNYHFHIDLNEWTFSVEPYIEPQSVLYALSVDGNPVHVYNVKVAPEDDSDRWAAMGDVLNSHKYFATAAFASFDMAQPVTVTVTLPKQVTSVKVLPSSAAIVPTISGNTFTYELTEPKKLTFEVNGEWVNALHVFANPVETDIPDPNDPNVIYFGPGIHEISALKIYSNQTLYLAEGAILKANPHYSAPASNFIVELVGNNIKIAGRGIIDAEGYSTHSRNFIGVNSCSNVTIDGIIITNSPTWTLSLRACTGVNINNIKIFGHRANSDGIDICNSSNVTVENCFLRTLDDLVVVKTLNNSPQSTNIIVRNCILWNEVAHALSIGAELRANVDNVLFTDCDVIHDKGREWTLRVYHCDAAVISNIRFENIRVEESKRLISLWIGEAGWSTDTERGHINGVTFKNINSTGNPLTVNLTGYDATHKIENVTFEQVRINNAPLTLQKITSNAYVENISVIN
jgi:hypothetical protein